ncbi:MAG: hypothetical protein C0154_03890 [Mucilaginibacter sp.]|nr:MAG: hypothetical protein BGO48_15190 [Mucilaginibacter sp. 44-25]PLW90928.1 MAG: hypothetical protein C0154_03890 [Mucilaginibacter sp.]
MDKAFMNKRRQTLLLIISSKYYAALLPIMLLYYRHQILTYNVSLKQLLQNLKKLNYIKQEW